ncbi:MAG: sensor histidine kinase, partial [Thermodesulfobacteriota bacterium]
VLETKDVHLIVDEGLWCEEICQDEAKVRQILRNLLNNALKYRRSRVELKVDKKDNAILFAVCDDGEGIPTAYHKRIFECYFQVNSTETGSVRGHGLGLAGVLVLVEDLGGRMTLESDQGQGTRFVVEIPLKSC